MKIRDIRNASVNIPQKTDGGRAVAEPQGMEFRGQLTSLSREAHMQHMNELAGRINEQGILVAKRADMKELQKYREMISELINETVSNSYAFSKSGTFDARGRHRVFAVVNRVNAKLDELAKEVLQEESDHIAMLDMVDDIRGLLVDIML